MFIDRLCQTDHNILNKHCFGYAQLRTATPAVSPFFLRALAFQYLKTTHCTRYDALKSHLLYHEGELEHNG